MWRDQRGFGWLVLIKWVVIIAVIVVVGVGVYRLVKGLGIGRGSGDNEGDGNTVEVSEEAEEFTPIIEEMEYVSVSVSGNEYIYQNNKVSLDELITQLTNSAEKISVRIMDADASRNAYTNLVEALRENQIRYIE